MAVSAEKLKLGVASGATVAAGVPNENEGVGFAVTLVGGTAKEIAAGLATAGGILKLKVGVGLAATGVAENENDGVVLGGSTATAVSTPGAENENDGVPLGATTSALVSASASTSASDSTSASASTETVSVLSSVSTVRAGALKENAGLVSPDATSASFTSGATNLTPPPNLANAAGFEEKERSLLTTCSGQSRSVKCTKRTALRHSIVSQYT